MADNEFDLGEAYSSYEQAQADRNFYLSMMQQGQQNRGAFMASPIAAYLAGISSVKMANERAKVQNIEDKIQAKKDATEAVERAKNYSLKIQNNMLDIAKAVNKGEISKGTAASMYGYMVKELGGTPISYDADSGIFTYDIGGEEYEADLSSQGISKKELEDAKTLRAESRIEWEREKQEKAIKAQKELAMIRKSGASAEKSTTLSSFNSSHKDVNAAFGKQFKMNRLTKAQVQSYIEGAEGLSENDKKSVQPKVEELLQLASKKGWTFTTPVKQAVSFDLNSLFERS